MADATDTTGQIRALARARGRIAAALTALVVVIYFGFIALIAFDKTLLARKLMPGLSLGIVLGAFVIVASWVSTWVYVRWANKHYDTQLSALGAREKAAPADAGTGSLHSE